jgi:hypothetical protein
MQQSESFKISIVSQLSFFREALKIVEEAFEDYACHKQDFLGDEEKWTKVLTQIPSEGLLQMKC